MKDILVATGNRGKLAEIGKILGPVSPGIKLICPLDLPHPPRVIESGKTYLDNALIKAKEYGKKYGLITLSDDSGLEVDYLDGGPGLCSARFAGPDAGDEENIAKLLDLMKGLSLTIILASHELEVVPSQVDEIICVNQKVFVHATPEEIKNTDVFREAYGCEFEFMLHGRYPHRVVERHGDDETDSS
jgi:hypothetical protein